MTAGLVRGNGRKAKCARLVFAFSFSSQLGACGHPKHKAYAYQGIVFVSAIQAGRV